MTHMKVQDTEAKDIGFIDTKVGLGFIIRQAWGRNSRDGNFKLDNIVRKKTTT